MIWLTIALLAVTVMASKAVGPLAVGGRSLPSGFQSVVALMAPSLLAGLVVVELLGAHWSAASWSTLAGMAVVAVVRLAARAPWVVAVVAGAVATALIRLFF